jgi:hypothetical protein
MPVMPLMKAHGTKTAHKTTCPGPPEDLLKIPPDMIDFINKTSITLSAEVDVAIHLSICWVVHIDWSGECAGLHIVSAPSPVMEATDDHSTCFYIHTFAAADGGTFALPSISFNGNGVAASVTRSRRLSPICSNVA